MCRETDEAWASEHVRCPRCDKSWAAVYCTCPTGLECPDCGTMVPIASLKVGRRLRLLRGGV